MTPQQREVYEQKVYEAQKAVDDLDYEIIALKKTLAQKTKDRAVAATKNSEVRRAYMLANVLGTPRKR